MYGRWVSVLGRLHEVAGGWWVRDLALAGTVLIGLVGLLVWAWARRKRKRGRDSAETRAGSARETSVAGLVSLSCQTSEADIVSRNPHEEAPRPDPAKVTFDLRLLVEQGAQPFLKRAQSKGLRFWTVVAANLPRQIRANPSGIALVLTSLLDNALRFTTEGAVRLEVAVTRDRTRHARVRFTVYDTGIGLDSETLARVLHGDASGQGLSVARRLVTEMGGTMGAESEPRGGSTFWFSIPVEIVKAARMVRLDAVAPAAILPLLPRASKPSGRILIVENDLANQVAILWAIRALGYFGEAASTEAAMFETCQRGPFDLVLLDWTSGEAPGIAAAIRRLETGCIPIIGMSHRADEASTAVDGFLPKPVCLVELAHMLDHWLGAAGPAYASEASSDRLSVPV